MGPLRMGGGLSAICADAFCHGGCQPFEFIGRGSLCFLCAACHRARRRLASFRQGGPSIFIDAGRHFIFHLFTLGSYIFHVERCPVLIIEDMGGIRSSLCRFGYFDVGIAEPFTTTACDDVMDSVDSWMRPYFV